MLKINKILKIIIIILLIAIAFLSVVYKFDNCNKCNFEYEGKKLNAQDFMEVYRQECLMPSPLKGIDFNNISFEDVEI